MSRTMRGKNIKVSVFEKASLPKAGDAFTRSLLMPTFACSGVFRCVQGVWGVWGVEVFGVCGVEDFRMVFRVWL